MLHEIKSDKWPVYLSIYLYEMIFHYIMQPKTEELDK